MIKYSAPRLKMRNFLIQLKTNEKYKCSIENVSTHRIFLLVKVKVINSRKRLVKREFQKEEEVIIDDV